MFRRRRREGGDQEEAGLRPLDEAASEADETGAAPDEPDAGGAADAGSGPWDAGSGYPEGERVDCGSLLVPLREGFDVQIHLADELGVWVAVIRGESGMQLQAFAAPRTMGLWDEIREEIAENITATGGRWEEAKGPAGAELRAWVPAVAPGQPGGPESAELESAELESAELESAELGPGGAAPAGAAVPAAADLQPVRFLGADGPRWFLRGVISGAAALDEALAGPFEELFADLVVVRGGHPMPPREQLEIKLPEAARQALEAEAGDDAGWGNLNPFERGPEITEIR